MIQDLSHPAAACMGLQSFLEPRKLTSGTRYSVQQNMIDYREDYGATTTLVLYPD